MAARCACLIQAAAELLESVGAANLSLRGIAERAGLSRQAPYNHFADKEPLLATLVVTGFDRLASQVDAASAHLGSTVLHGHGAAWRFTNCRHVGRCKFHQLWLMSVVAFLGLAESVSRPTTIASERG